MSSQKPGAARATVAGHPVTILREWTFSELPCKSQYFGFRVSGKLVQHPSVDEKFFGLDWNSTEIRGIHSNRVLISSNSSLYQLEGPPVPSSELSSIMEPFSQSTWPSDAQSRLREVSKIFGVDMSPQNGDIVLPQRRTRQSFNLGLRTRQSSNLGLDISPQNEGTPAERRNSARQAAAENEGTPAERRNSARQAAAENEGTPAKRRNSARQAAAENEGTPAKRRNSARQAAAENEGTPAKRRNSARQAAAENEGTPAERRNSARQAAAENGGTPAERRYSARQAAARAYKEWEEEEAERQVFVEQAKEWLAEYSARQAAAENGGTPAERRNSARQAAAENGGTPAERRYSARQAAARADKAGEEDEAERVDMSPQNGDVLLLQRRTRQSSNLGLDMSPQNGGSSNKMQLFAT
jgi:hypothetical protein